MKKKIFVFLILICGMLCACSVQKNEAVDATETPALTEELQEDDEEITQGGETVLDEALTEDETLSIDEASVTERTIGAMYAAILLKQEELEFTDKQAHSLYGTQTTGTLSELKWGYDGKYDIVGFAVVDLDNDTIPEVILEVEEYYGFIILHLEGNQVLGTGATYRSFSEIKQSGLSMSSSSADNCAINRVYFVKNIPFFYNYAEADYGQYTKNGITCEKEIWKQEYDMFLQSGAAEWYAVTEENVNAYILNNSQLNRLPAEVSDNVKARQKYLDSLFYLLEANYDIVDNDDERYQKATINYYNGCLEEMEKILALCREKLEPAELAELEAGQLLWQQSFEERMANMLAEYGIDETDELWEKNSGFLLWCYGDCAFDRTIQLINFYFDVEMPQQMQRELTPEEKSVDNKNIYGTWVIEKAVLWSEMYTGTTKDGVDEEDLYNPEDYIGYELEYSDEFFRLGDKKYENPQYVENYVTLEDFNDGGRFKTPTVYDVIDNEQIQVGNGETNVLETEVMMCIVDFEGETEYNGYSFIPVGTEIVLLNEDVMLVGVWGEILIARRIREDDSCAETAGAVEKLGLGEENYDFLVDCTGDSYAELKSAVDKIDFSSTFPPGEDLFGEEYRQLILCKTPFWVPETGKEIYLNQLKQLDNFMLDSYELDELVYYYFDIDGDNVAELGVTDEINFRYLFDYSEQDKRIILWKEMSSTWYNIIGTRKICWNNGGNNIAFYSLGEDGKDEVTIRLYSWEGPNKETGLAEIYYTVTFPNQEEYFSVTKEQYEEITGRYFEAEKESRQKIGEVSYSYQEMLELLNKEQGSCNSQSKTDKIEVLECIYADEQSNAEIYYPKLIGFNDKDKEKKINELIFKDIERVAIEGKNEIGKDFTIELKYDMKFIDENIISIFYYGMYGENSEGHGLSATAITTNIDINNEKLIMLKDIIIDYEELGRLLLSDKFRGITVWEGIRGTDTISREYLGNEEKLVENLKNEESDIKNHYIEWYIDGDEFVIVSLFSSIYQEYSMEIESMGEIFSEYFYELHKREHKVSSVDR